MEKKSVIVSFTHHSQHLAGQARILANSLNLPLVHSIDNLHDDQFILFVSEKGFELKVKETGSRKYSSLFIDFTHGPSGYRLRQDLTIHQPLARAVGIKAGFRPDILDATAGMGKDSFILAALGCHVTLVERSTIISALLSNGLERAGKEPGTPKNAVDRINLVNDDATHYMSTISKKPYTVYMDPMYPHRKKSALNKIEMRIIRQLVGDDSDSPALLQQALQTATNRVVIKRPKGAPTIDTTKPTHTIVMKNSRFDVYLCSILRWRMN